MKPDKPTHSDVNQGEGDRVSARHYNKRLRDFIKRGEGAPAAREAEAYGEGRPAEAARAEREAQRGPRSEHSRLDRLVAASRQAAELVRPIIHRIAQRSASALRNRLRRK